MLIMRRRRYYRLWIAMMISWSNFMMHKKKKQFVIAMNRKLWLRILLLLLLIIIITHLVMIKWQIFRMHHLYQFFIHTGVVLDVFISVSVFISMSISVSFSVSAYNTLFIGVATTTCRPILLQYVGCEIILLLCFIVQYILQYFWHIQLVVCFGLDCLSCHVNLALYDVTNVDPAPEFKTIIMVSKKRGKIVLIDNI